MEQADIKNTENAINAWVKSSDDNYDEMLDFFKINRNNWALFIGHLCLEKLFKAYFVKVNQKSAQPDSNCRAVGISAFTRTEK